MGDPLDVKTLRDFKHSYDLEIWAEASPVLPFIYTVF